MHPLFHLQQCVLVVLKALGHMCMSGSGTRVTPKVVDRLNSVVISCNLVDNRWVT
jgi:hypothetical protein